MNDVTIAIKTFERPESLKDLLASIRQFYPEIRIIVADDSKKPYAQEVARHFSNIECIPLPFDVGVSTGRNELLFRIKSKYFVMCDDDNIFYEQTKLENFKKILNETDIELVGGVVMDKSATGKFDKPNIYAGHFVLDAARNLRMEYVKPDKEVIRCDIVHQFFMAYTQAVVGKTGGWDPKLKLVDHTDFFWTAKKSGLRVAFTPTVSINHTGARPSEYIFYRTTRKNKYFLMHFKKLGIQSWTDEWATVTRSDVQPRWFKFIFEQKCIPWFITKIWGKLLRFIHVSKKTQKTK